MWKLVCCIGCRLLIRLVMWMLLGFIISVMWLLMMLVEVGVRLVLFCFVVLIMVGGGGVGLVFFGVLL